MTVLAVVFLALLGWHLMAATRLEQNGRMVALTAIGAWLVGAALAIWALA